MEAEIVRTFRFEAAHYLTNVPTGHPCGRMHGHSYVVDVHVAGPVGDAGWVIDFSDIERAFAPLLAALDHRLLNEVEGLANPTAEHLAAWIWDRLRKPLPMLAQVVLHETVDTRVIFRGNGATTDRTVA